MARYMNKTIVIQENQGELNFGSVLAIQAKFVVRRSGWLCDVFAHGIYTLVRDYYKLLEISES